MKKQVGLALVLLVLSAGAQAQVFKCVDGKGGVTFSQVPCAGQAAEKVEVRNNEIGGQFATDQQVTDNKLRREVERDIRKIDRALADAPKGACKPLSDTEVRTMVVRHQVVPGMKMQDVFKAWGRPDSVNGRQHVWWFGSLKGSYVYAEGGCVESMSGPGYRGGKFIR
ncbi:MAG: DUF4124 domain-containing protein [Gammaproteobacteria bacterium]|nr:DUF4124 domain-containing protein [Gammaproteobacteria bacterium]